MIAPDKRGMGQSIRALRTARGMTQKELAEKIGISEPALRGYELGIRYPKEKHVDAMAHALKVRPEAFGSYGLVTALDLVHALFNCEDVFRLEPDRRGLALLTSENRTISEALRDWGIMRSKLENGELSDQEYQEWKATYNPSIRIDDIGSGEVADPYTGKLGSQNRPKA